MKGYNYWSYAPYKPLLWDSGDIYICRVCPEEDRIHIEWLEAGEAEVYARKRECGEFALCGKTDKREFDILNLETDTDYEFYVKSGDKKSRIRLARCGEHVGIIVNYLHPDDNVYGFSGRYLCSPSLLRHPEGYLLASMDLFGYSTPQNLSIIFRSDDDGKTWHYVSELMPCFWGKLFIHKGELYMLGCSTEYGDLLIGKSTDGGKTFSAPVTLLRGANGKEGMSGFHKNPQNVVHFGGRIYETLEWGNWQNQEYCHAAMVMSADEAADLLNPESWSFTEPKRFNPKDAPEISHLPENTGTIEGTLVPAPDGKLYNIMRFHGDMGKMLCYELDTENPEAPLKYSNLVDIEAYPVKFMIKFDEVSGKYYTIANRIFNREIGHCRNLLSFFSSSDLKTWDVECDLIDYSHGDPDKIGFQYVDFSIEGDDIIFLCRTAINNAHNMHDSNYSTFHRIENFRSIKKLS